MSRSGHRPQGCGARLLGTGRARTIEAIVRGNGWTIVTLALLAACHISAVTFTPLDDALDDAGPARDGLALDAAIDAVPGTAGAPAPSCRQLLTIIGPISGVYWLQDDVSQPAYQAYCEQEIDGGGWAVIYNSELHLDGTTTAFWNISYADRLATIGAPSNSDNYYAGSMYRRGTSFLDVITDLDDKKAVAARVDSQGFDPASMQFMSPILVAGNPSVFQAQVAAGWSSPDHDGDTYQDNCATFYSNVSQHYSNCWIYNLGSDADSPFFDSGVGPHVHSGILSQLGLTPQVGGGNYSRVKRITRHVRW